MKRMHTWLAPCLMLIVIAASPGKLTAQGFEALIPVVTQGQKSAFATVRVLGLVLEEQYEANGEAPEVTVREAVTEALRAVHLDLGAAHNAEATLVLRVRSGPATPRRQEASRCRWGKKAVEVTAEATLVFRGVQPVWAKWSQVTCVDAMPSSVRPIQQLADECAVSSVLSLLSQLQPEALEGVKEAEDSRLRYSAVNVRAASARVEAVPLLIALLRRALERGDAGAQLGLAHELAKIGPSAAPAVPLLVETLDGDPIVRSAACRALRSIGAGAVLAVPRLTKILEDEDGFVRIAAAEALGSIGPPAGVAVPALIRALDDEEFFVRETAAKALGYLGPAAEPAVPALIDVLGDHRSFIRETAAQSLGYVGPRAKQAVLPLARALRDQHLGPVAARALSRIGVAAVPALIEALDDENARVRKNAALALGQIGPLASASIPKLIDALHDDAWLLPGSAAWALGHIGSRAEAAVPALTEALGDESAILRMAAAEALGRIGSAARPAVPALELLVADRDVAVSSAAREALERIQPEQAVTGKRR